ncbi:MAG: BlaI/MecI/CopY family transcriptional regulator [Myxococcales bacterium FL481]|nr:MAG: BlaI/MecI/CopY family transcriptional regulator [Myxococcales bacterium FL481]
MESQPLSDMQMAFMRVLWDLHEAHLGQVQAQLDANGLSLAPTTVATVLRRMEKKGWVAHRREGRQFIYRAAVSRDELGENVLSRITSALYGGDVAAVFAQLLGSSDVEADELAAIKALIAAKEERGP